ncbi:MAG: O-methyltransferase [Candidatus Heimdallarchaeota archaeon]|nr:MAG: O-methyltransferase [Candidatus Heimdallarchaeota archaeon]
MEILMDGLQDYLLDLLGKKRNSVILEMEKYANKHEFPIVGPLVGQLLSQYTQLISANRILELGSGYGYSAIYFAKAASDETEIICTDTSEENKNLAFSYFKRLAITNIKFIVGDALKVINQLQGKFDIIFNDVDKQRYPQAFNLAVPKLRKGGLLITDNALWYGQVLESKPKRESTVGVKEYNTLAFSDPRVLSTIIPIGDGICVSIKQ